ncbi:MAG: chromate transporter [Pseudomonadota bacterium]
MNPGALLALVTLFLPLSLLSFGGNSAILPEIHREAVQLQGWLTDRQFSDLFAISRAAPGPSSLFDSLIGLAAAGVLGAVVALVAVLLPSSVLMLAVTHTWKRFQGAKLQVAIERGLAPITIGLLFATGLIVIQASDHGIAGVLVTIGTTIVLVRTKVSPLVLMVIASCMGWFGWV